MPDRGFSRAEARWLLDGRAKACAYGGITWSGVNGAWRGRVSVAGDGIEPGSVILEFQARPGPRACQPSVLLLYRSEACRRVDVNGAHLMPDGTRFIGTHIQGRDDWTDARQMFESPPEWFPGMADEGDTVSEGAYHRVFHAFARYCNIDTSAVEWIDPPEGRP